MKKRDKIKDFFQMTPGELEILLREKREKLRQFRFDLASGKVKDVSQIREARKDIARIITILKAKKSQNSLKEKAGKKD
ncbi:50S ribosomal protein L29 [bacterium]|nr:50S ribosomal protein L29 [bacterium]